MGAMGATMAISSMASLGTAYSQSQAIKADGAYKSAVATTNARLSDFQADQAKQAGDEAAARKNSETNQRVASIRAAQGASGTDVNSGSNKLVQETYKEAGTVDELTIRNNAARQAWGYKTQAITDSFEGKFANLTAATSAQQTLLTGGLAAINNPMQIEANYLKLTRGMGGTGTSSPYPEEPI